MDLTSESDEFPGFSRFAMVFGPLVLQAQGELEARKTCVVKPLSRSSRKIKTFETIFSGKKVTTDSFRTNFGNFACTIPIIAGAKRKLTGISNDTFRL